jgi:uncharacterized repeat protein (TIGR01451 family)
VPLTVAGSDAGTVSAGGGVPLTVAGSHTYADEGTFTATVVLADDAPGTATATATSTVNVAEGDTLTATGTPVTATATEGTTFSSTALATFSTTYTGNVPSDFTATINWGDGTSSTGTVSGTSSALTVAGNHVYTAAGTETATVILSDDAPGTATATATATITVASPNTITPVGTVTIIATEGTTFSSTALATFTESDASVPASDFTATINWGDGTSTTGVSVTGTGGTLAVAGTHLYTDELASGTASVVVTQTTAGAATGTATGSANVADADTLAAGTPVTATATEGTTFSGTVATFTNTGYPANVASDFTATINWGDGSTSTVSGSSITGTGGTLAVAGSHVYTAAGTETATVILSDDAPGTASATATATITVTHVTAAPTLTITKSASAMGAVGQNLTYTVDIANTGTGAATGTTFTDPLPANLIFVSATDSLGGSITNTGGTLIEDIGSLAAGATDVITIIVTPGSSLAGTSVTNTASVSATNFNGGAAINASATTSISSTVIKTGVGFVAGVPGDGTIATFVHNLYRQLLGREPDANGETYWETLLQQNNTPAERTKVIAAFLNTPEYAIHYITTLYQVILGRAPDADGLQFWTQKMGQPGTAGQHSGSADEKYIVAAFFGSDEFYLKSGNTPEGWINALYEDILGRAPDGSGAAFWASELATRGAGDRDGIVRDLLTMPEAAHDLLDTFYPAPGGTASTPLAAPGTKAGTGRDDLAVITGDGWENLYLQGPFDSQPEGNDAFFTSLTGGAGWDDLQAMILNTDQYYINPNRPITV